MTCVLIKIISIKNIFNIFTFVIVNVLTTSISIRIIFQIDKKLKKVIRNWEFWKTCFNNCRFEISNFVFFDFSNRDELIDDENVNLKIVYQNIVFWVFCIDFNDDFDMLISVATHDHDHEFALFRNFDHCLTFLYFKKYFDFFNFRVKNYEERNFTWIKLFVFFLKKHSLKNVFISTNVKRWLKNNITFISIYFFFSSTTNFFVKQFSSFLNSIYVNKIDQLMFILFSKSIAYFFHFF